MAIRRIASILFCVLTFSQNPAWACIHLRNVVPTIESAKRARGIAKNYRTPAPGGHPTRTVESATTRGAGKEVGPTSQP